MMNTLRDWQHQHELTDQAAADLLGVHRVTWARWKNDAAPIPPYLPLALAALEERFGRAPPAEADTR